MRIAIVGSRTYPRLDKVVSFIYSLPMDTVVVSGGAEGVDNCAARTAKARELPEPIVHRPNCPPNSTYIEFTKACYARNQKIVDDCDRLVAFTEKEKGGTWNTIRSALKAGKPVEIIS